MRSPLLNLLPCALALALAACGSFGDVQVPAEPGLRAQLDGPPQVTIDDEFGTEVRVFLDLDHLGGPDVETLEVVSASLRLDGELYADVELAIPADHSPFAGLAEGEELDLELRGSLPDTHADWSLCEDPQSEGDTRVSLDLVLLATPGANDDEDEFSFHAYAVELACSFTG